MRSRGIEFYRFIFAIIVCLHHIRGQIVAGSNLSVFWGAGYLAVDLFFVISGYFLAAHYDRTHAIEEEERTPGEMALHYAVGRWKRIFAFHTYAWLVAGVVQIYVWKSVGWKQVLSDGFFEFFMLEATGIGNNNRVNGTGWYCSALILCSLVIYYLLCKHKKNYIFFVVPVSAVVIFSYLRNQYGNLNRWTQNPLLLCDGLFRGFAEMGLGCVCYYVVLAIKREKLFPVLPEKWERIIYSIGEVGCLGVILVTMWKPQGHMLGNDVALEFICIPVMAVFIIIVLSEKSILHRVMDNRVSEILGKLSFYVYLNHAIIQRTISKYMADVDVHRVLGIYLIVVIFYSVLTMAIFEPFDFGAIIGVHNFPEEDSSR